MKALNWLAALAAVIATPVIAAVEERNITLPDGLGSAVVYVASDAQPGPGVIVVHEWWGLDDYARDRARQLAEAGHTAIAVDMYGHGRVADHPKDARGFMEAALAEPDMVNARFAAARDALVAVANVDAARVYAIGYCFGGAVVLNQARIGADLAGVASFHGPLGTTNPAARDTLKARILVATGGADPMVPPEQVGGFVTEMSQAGAEFSLLSFPGVVHSFTSPAATAVGREHDLPFAYDRHADEESWAALMDFIR